MKEKVSKSAFVAIVGKPNVGKSSLLNCLLGEKIAIVTSKPQTTRTRITGVLTRESCQFVFIDTPGFHKPLNKLSDYMDEAVTSSIHDVDIVLLLVEPSGGLNAAEKILIDTIKACRAKKILVINKIDLLKEKEKLYSRINELTLLCPFDAVIPVSVTEHDGVDRIFYELEHLAKPGVHYFPDDALTDQPERVITAEILREKLLLNLQQEIPHGTAVVIEKQREREDCSIVDIEAVIYCEKSSHKGMIIGKGGACLKKIASEARRDIERFLGCKVNLQCWVKVKEDWRNSDNMIKNFGLRES